MKKRIVIMTVGKTHSGKTTFAKALEVHLPNSVVIDQDNHAEFLNTHYKSLLPKTATNNLKYGLTQMIVDYAVNETDCHLILCNSNRGIGGRVRFLEYYKSLGFTTIVLNFDIPEEVLLERVKNSERSTSILRTALNFEEVLMRQNGEEVTDPSEEEADYLYVIKNTEDAQTVISEIVRLA
ncbi:ATP-binding protein [Psychrobacillus sp. MER TA 171]|uniref:AAA family ATPase n=1 Tax=Psychrobacillus sp. MER TA 171 TaxID=2939577 RepID=UPI00203BCE40|nr:ATP-binding protein [Psychrobacillus sp. MER TA 171]MCM3357686.1 ATP-binding protein [Psychrobacillus sp. MER TA 171]